MASTNDKYVGIINVLCTYTTSIYINIYKLQITSFFLNIGMVENLGTRDSYEIIIELIESHLLKIRLKPSSL